MGTTPSQFIQAVAESHRVLVLGGLAVIAHGYSRATKDADIWLEPLETAAEWSQFVEEICSRFDGLTIHTLPGWVAETGEELTRSVEETGRDQDLEDLSFLESVLKKDYLRDLPQASFSEAKRLLERFADFEVLQAALTNPDEQVSNLAKNYLREFPEQGDPFSQAILEGRELP